MSLTVNLRSGCQKEIAKKIKEKETNYPLALKGNQGTLSEDVELFFTEQKSRKFADTATEPHVSPKSCALMLVSPGETQPREPPDFWLHCRISRLDHVPDHAVHIVAAAIVPPSRREEHQALVLSDSVISHGICISAKGTALNR